MMYILLRSGSSVHSAGKPSVEFDSKLRNQEVGVFLLCRTVKRQDPAMYIRLLC